MSELYGRSLYWHIIRIKRAQNHAHRMYFVIMSGMPQYKEMTKKEFARYMEYIGINAGAKTV
jgi:hypothetical protein